MTSLLLQRSRGLCPPCVLDSAPQALRRSGGLRWLLSVLGKHVAAAGPQSGTPEQDSPPSPGVWESFRDRVE